MPLTKVKEFLDSHRVKYVLVQHSVAFTAQEIAARAHISGNEIAKTVIVKLDDKMAMTVVPASRRVSFEKLRTASGAQTVDLASEEEFSQAFPRCEVGAMPPFGNLYGMPVYLCENLGETDEITFNACSHVELIRMPFGDFVRLVHPVMAILSE